MRIDVSISTNNEAFYEDDLDSEVARILRCLAKDIGQGYKPTKLKDYNGNTVGSVEYLED